MLDDGYKTMPCKFKITEKDTKKNQCSFDLTIYEGKNRQIRRMCEALGYQVITLKRVRIMGVRLGDLKPGQYRKLTEQELEELSSMLEYSTNQPVKVRRSTGRRERKGNRRPRT